jgi:tetratricopeptide (TPR) repeat protein
MVAVYQAMVERASTPPSHDGEYTLRRVGELLGLPIARVRSLARAAGLLGASFRFADVVVLRSLAGLVAARVSPRSMRGALERLQRTGESLAGVSLTAQGRAVVVRDDAGLWDAETGQGCLDFARPAGELGEVVSLAARAPAPPAAPPLPAPTQALDADEWFDLAQGAEKDDPAAALEAYQQVLAISPTHYPTLVNIGRLWHESGETARAEASYRAALAAEPSLPLGRFNLAVLLDDTGRTDEAIACYRAVLETDPGFADAHFNLARLYERVGDKLGAVRHLSRYRNLSR